MESSEETKIQMEVVSLAKNKPFSKLLPKLPGWFAI